MILYGCTVHHCSLPYTLELGEWNTVTATFVHSPGYAYLVHNGIIPSVGSVQVRQAYDAHFSSLAKFSPSINLAKQQSLQRSLPNFGTQPFLKCEQQLLMEPHKLTLLPL